MTAILDPFMVGGYGAPKLALAPLFILWFGIGIESKIALVAITVFFIVYFSAQAGVRALDARLVQMAKVVGANERQLARHIVFPGAVPYIFTGLRIAMPYSIGGAVIAELISSNRGLGYLIQLGAMNFDTTGVFVALVATTCIVFLGNWSVNAARAAAVALAARRRHADAGADMSALLEIRDLGKRFPARNGATSLAVGHPGPELLGARGRVPHHHRPVGRRQDHAAQHDRADRQRERRRDPLPVGTRADRRSQGAQAGPRPAASAT